MIDARQAAQLIRNLWPSPTELAKELVALATSTAPRLIEAPVTINVAVGRTALRVVQGPAAVTPRRSLPTVTSRPAVFVPDAPVVPGPTATAEPDRPRRPAAPPASPVVADTTATPGSPGRPSIPPPAAARGLDAAPTRPKGEPPRPELHDTRPAPSRVTSGPVSAPAPPRETSTPNDAPAPRRPASANLAEAAPPARVRDEAATLRPLAESGRLPSAPAATYGEKYVSPTFEVVGPVSFGGDPPVQFDRPPLLLDPSTGQYRPLVDQSTVDSDATRVPFVDALVITMIGKVTGGTGESWDVTLYPGGVPPTSGDGSNPDDTSDVTVACPGAGKNYLAPVDQWIGPILVYNDPAGTEENVYYYFAPFWAMKRIAKSGAGGIPAMAANIPGKATDVVLYTFDGTTALAVDKTGQTVFNLDPTNPVGASKFLQVVTIEGRLFVDWETC